MLTRIKIKNFKSIGDPGVDLELKPLTLLVGPNGGGKSSILESLAIFEASLPSPVWAIDWVHRRQTQREVSIELWWNRNIALKYSFCGAPPYAMEDYRAEWVPIAGIEVTSEDQKTGQVQRVARERLEGKVFLISAFRGQLKAYDSSGSEPASNKGVYWTGEHGQGLIAFLTYLSQPEFIDVRRKIEKWAEAFGLPDLWAGQRSTRGTTVVFRDFETLLEGAFASYGSRQILTIIANLFGCPEGSIFLIEEPEISLHPEAQVKVVSLFAEAVKEQKQIIATTHSTFLVLALGATVQKGLLKAEDIAIYHVEKQPEVGTVATRLPVNEHGYVEGWIPSFAREERKLLREWWKTVPEETAPAEQ